MQITSVEGRLLRDPQTGREISGPTDVGDTDPFYLRAIANGDVTDDANAIAAAHAATAQTAAAPAAAPQITATKGTK